MNDTTRPTRRGLIAGGLAGLGALPLVSCKRDPEGPGGPGDPQPAPERPPEPAAWSPEGMVDETAFAWSVLAGDALADGIVLAVRTLEPEVGLVVVGETEDGWEEVHTASGLAAVEGSVRVEVTGLPDRAHRFVFTTDDGRRSPVGRFRTNLADDGYRKLVFGATSCLGDVDPDWPNLGFVAEHELDFLILLGDTVYADGAVTREEYRDHWRRAFAKPTLNGALASTSVVAVWDDHEVSNDWRLDDDGSAIQDVVTPAQVADARAVFEESLPQRTGATGPLYRSIRWGTVVELIAMDCRGERDADHIVSDEQLEWAIQRIQTSPCWLKLVLVSVHMTDHTALMATINEIDRWQGYPAQREALVAAAAATPGVLFVTGDMHYGAIQRVSPDGVVGDGVREVAAGPSGSELLSVSGIVELLGETPPQYEDVVEDWTWTRFEIDPGLGEVRIQMIGDEGQVLVDRVLTP